MDWLMPTKWFRSFASLWARSAEDDFFYPTEREEFERQREMLKTESLWRRVS